ncbi:MAG TPA: VanW family protein [Gaiellaceae bacterium]
MRRRVIVLVLVLAATLVVLGLVFAGSPTTIANGVTIAGVDVGGMRTKDARALLERKSAAVKNRTVVFVAGGRRFRIRPVELGVQPDWKAAVASAQRQGDGFGPIRALKRLDVQFFGADVTPPTSVLHGALNYEVSRIAAAVDRKPQSASLVRRGMTVSLVPARAGLVLDRAAATRTIVHELASLETAPTTVELPLVTTQPTVQAATLARAARRARLALSAPVHLELGKTRWILTPRKLAPLLELPADGRTDIRIGGPAADAWLVKLGRRVQKPAHDANFSINGSHIGIVPAQPGTRLDAVGTARAVLDAALKRRPALRVALLPVAAQPAKLSTDAARAMHITGVVGSYTTEYGGIPNRIHNVQLVAHLVDDKLIAPGATFSFNKTTGERNAAKGFLEAPVIVNGELTTGLGGGVCQVSTTVFNAAFVAGLDITERVNHALYISHYPQGRDATVDYPDVDLKFVNDTGNWLLLRTFVGPSTLTVGLYGTPTHRKVTSTVSPLVVRGEPPVQKTVDKSLKPGEVVVDDPGVPAMSTSVTRDVYAPNGKLLHHDTWYSSYRASPKLVRIGPKKHKPKPSPTDTATTSTTTTQTTTQPSG